MSDEDIISTLAYTKSPKFSKRTSFQEELQEALIARAAKQQSAEYAEDFESDEGMEEEIPESVKNYPPKSVIFAESPSHFNLFNRSTLENESADDLSSSDEDEGSQYVSTLKREVLSEERQAIPFSLTEHSRLGEKSAAKQSIPFEIPLSDHYSFESETVDDLALAKYKERTQETALSVHKESKHLIKEIDNDTVTEKEANCQEECSYLEGTTRSELTVEKEDMTQYIKEKKPVPKPREFKIKAASASAENISIPALYDFSKPSPQPRSVLRKSSHVEDYEGTKTEDRISYHHRLFSLSAPSSETRLNDQLIRSEKRALSESPGAEGPLIASSSSSFPIHLSSVNEQTGDSNLIVSGDESFSKEKEKHEEQKGIDNCQDQKLLESDRKSPSVLEVMMTTVYEKSKNLCKSTEEGKGKIIKPSVIKNQPTETTMDHKSERKLALSTSKSVVENSEDSVKEEGEDIEAAQQKAKIRSLSATYLRRTGKHSPIPTSTSSQYLGTLKVLDNKHLQKYSAELDKADSLRAAVYQDWLEKKRIFFLELQRIKRNKAENLREKNEKKEVAKREEALASFEAWKTMKEKEAKKLAEKKKMEEAKKQKKAELNEKKKEDAQKAFEKWKEKKAEYLKQQLERENRIERLKKKKEQEVVAEKRKDSRSAVEKWNERKEEFMKQKKKEKNQERKKEEEQEAEKEEQDKKAVEEYEKWLEKKEVDKKIQKKPKKLQVILEDETPPPWSPPGKAVTSRRY